MKLPEIRIKIDYKGDRSQLLTLRKSHEIAHTLRELFTDGSIFWVEEVIILCLDNAFQCIGYYKVSKGGMTQALVDVKVIAMIALNSLAKHVVLCHNHPSGNLTPSESDKIMTSKVRDGLNILDITLLDHIILSDTSFYSFADDGIL